MKRVLTLCLCAALLLSLAACGSAPEVTLPAPEGEAEAAPTTEPTPTPTPTPEPTPEPTPSVVKLTLAGDLVMHTPLHDEALQPDGSYDYAPIFEDVAHYVEEADYALCCFEGAFTGDGKWTGYPLFHVPDLSLIHILRMLALSIPIMRSQRS